MAAVPRRQGARRGLHGARQRRLRGEVTMPRQLSRSPPAPRSAWLLSVLAIMLVAGPACADAPVSLATPGATLDEVLAIARRLSPELAARALDTEPRRRA